MAYLRFTREHGLEWSREGQLAWLILGIEDGRLRAIDGEIEDLGVAFTNLSNACIEAGIEPERLMNGAVAFVDTEDPPFGSVELRSVVITGDPANRFELGPVLFASA